MNISAGIADVKWLKPAGMRTTEMPGAPVAVLIIQNVYSALRQEDLKRRFHAA